MGRSWATRCCLVGIALTGLIACSAAPAPTAQGTAPPAAPTASALPRRVTAAILSNPATLNRNSLASDGGEGLDTVFDALHSGLTIADDQGSLLPLLAEAAPSLENGLWKVFPDGRMETTWKIRPNAVWHDGSPFTSDDIAFTVQVHQDADLPVAPDRTARLIDSVATP